jgi:hypothetical protein
MQWRGGGAPFLSHSSDFSPLTPPLSNGIKNQGLYNFFAPCIVDYISEFLRAKRIFIVKIYNSPIKPQVNLELPKTNHLYNTRRRDDIYLCKPKTNWGKQKLLYQACKEYNDLDYNTRSIEQLGTFRNGLFKSLSL